MPELSVVIPCYNESRNIPVLLQRFNEFKSRDFELILVNNGSTDDTAAILDRELKKYRFARSVFIKNNIGYGHGIMTGLRAAKGHVLSYTHADLQSSPADVFRALEVYEKGALSKGVRIRRRMRSAILARALDIVASIVMRSLFYDINAQPKLFSREFLKKLNNAPNGYYLDLFIIAKAKKLGMPIKEIPVVFEKRLHGVSSWQRSFMTRARTIILFFFACFEVRRLVG